MNVALEAKIAQAIEKFEQESLNIIEEPCNCGMRIRHNNGGNYHQNILIRKDKVGVYVMYGDTCELTEDDDWREIQPAQVIEIIHRYADWL